MSEPSSVETRSRAELIEDARRAGVERPERMTMAELRDEILRRTKPASEVVEARGLFGIARTMLAGVVENGLNLPDAARMIRGTEAFDSKVRKTTPVATVTLAEIYAAQGHKARALRMVEEVLEQEPDHEVALRVKRDLLRSVEVDSKTTTLATPASSAAPIPYVESTGEEIRTGQPPEVATAGPASDGPASDGLAPAEPAPAEPAPGLAASSPEMASMAQENPVLEPNLWLEVEDGGTVFFYWELTAEAIERAGFERKEAHPALRVVAFLPHRGLPSRTERTIALQYEIGSLRLGDIERGAAVRAAVGVEQDGTFVPLSVGKRPEEWSEEEPFAGRAMSAR